MTPDPQACPFCGEPPVLEIFEIWNAREFMLETCCEGMHEAVGHYDLADPQAGRELLRELGIEDLCPFGKLRSVADDGCGGLILDWKVEIRPIRRDDAKAFVRAHHRRNRPPCGWRFGAGAFNGPELVGVAMVGRPVARRLDHLTIVEVNRLCVTEQVPKALSRHVCSQLYAWAAREARRRGFAKIITYTLEAESGASVQAAGWSPELVTRGGSWDRPSRARADHASTSRKRRWALELAG